MKNQKETIKIFIFFHIEEMNRFIKIYEDSTLIYSHYGAFKIIDDRTIQINNIDVWDAIVHLFCTYDFNLQIFGDFKIKEIA